MAWRRIKILAVKAEHFADKVTNYPWGFPALNIHKDIVNFTHGLALGIVIGIFIGLIIIRAL